MFGGCADDTSDAPSAGDDAPAGDLSGDAAAGEAIARERGCAGCHGADFSGGIGPSWVGLYGSTVTLEDGSTVTADDAYLTRAIEDPSAERVADFAIATTFPYRDAVGFDLADTPRVAAWMRRMESRPSWQAATAPMRAFFAR